MGLVRLLLLVRFVFYAAATASLVLWALTATDIGQTVTRIASGYRDAAPSAADLADSEMLGEYSDEARAALAIAGLSTRSFANQASAVAYGAARSLPDAADLASALEGWQTDLLEYEADLRASLPEGVTQEEIERRMAELFEPRTTARPLDTPVPTPAPTPPPVTPPVEEPPAAQPEQPPAAEPEQPAAPPPVEPEPVEPAPEAAAPPPARAVAFQPHPAFYKCPVIEVSNSGPVDDELTLIEYTPWIDTPAGVLIRAPIAGACLSSGYGTRTVDGASKSHAGVDYYNREGGAIYAAGDGVVTQAGEDGAYGYSVHIDHGNGVEGHYAHMVAGSLRVSVGDQVTLGQQIGVMGASGRAFAVHLHYELRFAGETIDPLYEGKRAAY